MRTVLWIFWLVLLVVLSAPVYGDDSDSGIRLDIPRLDTPPVHSTEREEDRMSQQRRAVYRLQRQMVTEFRAGRYQRARDIAERIVDLNPENGIGWYNLGCAHSRLGQYDLAIGHLRTAVEKGFTGIRYMERDPDLAPLHGLQDFRDLLAMRDELQRRRAERIIRRLREQFGEGYLLDVDHDSRMVFATNVDRETLEDLKTELTAQAESLWDELFDHPFERYVTIIIPKPGTIQTGEASGVYRDDDAILVAKRVGMVLRHEFTHAMHFADQEARGQFHPIWLLEGLATLYETSRFQQGRLVPTPNDRLNSLKYYIRNDRMVSLEALLEMDQKTFMQKAGQTYSTSRYLLMYLYEQGKLAAFYQTYTKGYDRDSSGRVALETTLGAKLADIEAEWLEWVKQQPAPPMSVRPSHAYIGVQTRSRTEGLEIRRVVPGSGAERAGLRAGDVLVKLNARRVADMLELIRIVNRHEVGDVLRVRFRRGPEYHETDITLGPKPHTIP